MNDYYIIIIHNWMYLVIKLSNNQIQLIIDSNF